MAFWNRKKVVTETAPQQRSRVSESAVLGQGDVLERILGLGAAGAHQNARTASGALSLYDSSTAVSVPVNAVAESFAQLTPVLRFDDGSVEKDHELLQLLKRPSPFFDGRLFAETLAKNYLITGECFVVAVGRINAPPIQLNPVSPANVNLETALHSLVAAFEVTNDLMADTYPAEEENALSVRYLDQRQLKEIQQIRSYSTSGNSTLRGQSPLVSAAKEVKQHILGGVHNSSLLSRGGRPTANFHFEEDLNEDDFLEAQERVQSNYSGAENAGMVAVTAGPSLQITELGINMRDMDFAALQRMIRQVMAQVYHVPLPLIDQSSQTFNNYETAKEALFDDAVGPLAGRIYAGLGELLLPRYSLDPAQVQIAFDPEQVPALERRHFENLKFRRDLNIESLNELRSGAGLDDYDETAEGGDAIYQPSSLTKIGADPLGDPFAGDIGGGGPPNDDADDLDAPVDPAAPAVPVEPDDESAHGKTGAKEAVTGAAGVNNHTHSIPDGASSGTTSTSEGHTHSFDTSNARTGVTNDHSHTI
jgi:HK97 family phage portal protein